MKRNQTINLLTKNLHLTDIQLSEVRDCLHLAYVAGYDQGRQAIETVIEQAQVMGRQYVKLSELQDTVLELRYEDNLMK